MSGARARGRFDPAQERWNHGEAQPRPRPSYVDTSEALVQKLEALQDTVNIQRDALRLLWDTYQGQDILNLFLDHVSDAGRKDSVQVTVLLARLLSHLQEDDDGEITFERLELFFEQYAPDEPVAATAPETQLEAGAFGFLTLRNSRSGPRW